MTEIPLGRQTAYPKRYTPEILFPIARAGNRGKLGIGLQLPFRGVDVWTAWELTWLWPSGKPAAAAAEIRVPADSPNIIESKSLKLYLNSFAMTAMESEARLCDTIERDLGSVAGAPVSVSIFDSSTITDMPGESLDVLDVNLDTYEVDPQLLESDDSEPVAEIWRSSLLRSLCPVTSQPDFGAVMVAYEGPRIRPESLLAYVVSYREHQDFHESCVERMFVDLKERCKPGKLSVYARYQRRGGLDINPFRSDYQGKPPVARTWNQ